MSLHPLAGKPAPADSLIDVDKLIGSYYDTAPDPGEPAQQVRFGTSGHRGSSVKAAFNEAHIIAVTAALCEYRKNQNITGPLFLGKDTHALSRPAEKTALEVLAAAGVETIIQENDGYTPTPVISHAILQYNRARKDGLSDGVVITPSHNPPADGGFKYNPPHGGPADSDATGWIQDRANEILLAGVDKIRRVRVESGSGPTNVTETDLITPYVNDLQSAIDFGVIRSAGLKLGVDPLGGAGVHYWARIVERYGINITVVNTTVDPTFRFLTLDHDGKIRMDCSSPYAMASLVAMKDRFDLAFGNDADADRHGIVTPTHGLLNPNHYLAVSVNYLFSQRKDWPLHASIGKTLVSSSMIDRVANLRGRSVVEVPVGFKWFVQGLQDGSLGFAGEESAGATFLRQNGEVWTTDKDGILLNLLAAEITASAGKNPGEIYDDLTEKLGKPYYRRIDRPATMAEKERLKNLSSESVTADMLAGEPIRSKLTRAPGNDAAIGGLKVTTDNGWFAARPSGTEDICKIYAESFLGEEHLEKIIEEAREISAAGCGAAS